MARHRRFSFEFKRQLVLDVLEEGVGVREMARKHCISRSLIRQWIQRYETGQLTDELDEVRIAEYEGKIAELERKVGQLTMEVELLKKGALGTSAQRRHYLQQFNCERPEGFSVARGCRTMKLARSTYYYRSRRAAAREKALCERIVGLCEEFPRYGYRRVGTNSAPKGCRSIIRRWPA